MSPMFEIVIIHLKVGAQKKTKRINVMVRSCAHNSDENILTREGSCWMSHKGFDAFRKEASLKAGSLEHWGDTKHFVLVF